MGRRFRANKDLTIPLVPGRRQVAKGDQVSEEDIGEFVNPDALVQGGFLSELDADPMKCAACALDGTAKQKKETYNAETLAEHYAAEHPALAPQEA